jgi:hypothetical protein
MLRKVPHFGLLNWQLFNVLYTYIYYVSRAGAEHFRKRYLHFRSFCCLYILKQQSVRASQVNQKLKMSLQLHNNIYRSVLYSVSIQLITLLSLFFVNK